MTQKKKPSDDLVEKTEVLKGEQETLNRELEEGGKQPASLIMVRGNFPNRPFLLPSAEMTIGRDPTKSDITIDDASISRAHAKISLQDTANFLTDLGSSNGTFLNGEKLAPNKAYLLEKEDMIRMGNTIFKFLPPGQYETLKQKEGFEESSTDPLTGAANRRFLEKALNIEFKRAKTLGNDLSVLIFDIDHFKKINDTHGHDGGDYILKELARVIRASYLGAMDVFARYGGEEFVILFLNTPLSQAVDTAEKIRAAIEAHHFIYEGRRIPVTISSGITEMNATVESYQSLIKTADKALYESKSAGRNRVTSTG